MKNIFAKAAAGAMVLCAAAMMQAQKIDTKSRQILDAVTTNYKAKKNSYFKFTFGSGVNGQVNKTETGIYYAEGPKYKLKIMGTEQIFDGNKIYNVNDDEKEVTIAKPNGSDIMFSPTSYLTSYKKDFNATYSGKRMVNGVNTDFIKLTPVKSNGLKQVNLYVDSASKQLVKLEQHGTNKDVAVIAIQEYKVNQNLASDMFTFNKQKFQNYVITEL
ncbi:outer membrane lipoprotein carrier protein LolA [Chryseobacterium sp. cx-311]|uniref:LolA family protein n=1 Tax=Marnyiella aurantia TaxID=2758037 RepID=UPI001AE44901|nr:outer membrane lipoprotein carrier protein LolA [Marnyiella aurantia]MBP0612751.1 outer membrane lipoprotein carrier protein LolA [Marnyiella aurantia]